MLTVQYTVQSKNKICFMSRKNWKKVWGRFVVQISPTTLLNLFEKRFDFQFTSRKLIIKS